MISSLLLAFSAVSVKFKNFSTPPGGPRARPERLGAQQQTSQVPILKIGPERLQHSDPDCENAGSRQGDRL